MRFNKIEFFFFAIIRIKWKLDQYMIIIIQRFLFIVLYESKLLYNIYIKSIYFHIHMQLLFYNAKLMYCSIIVMDFSDFPIFDKRQKNLEIQWSQYQDSILLFDNYDKFDPNFLQSNIFAIFLQDIRCKFCKQYMDLYPQNLP